MSNADSKTAGTGTPCLFTFLKILVHCLVELNRKAYGYLQTSHCYKQRAAVKIIKFSKCAAQPIPI